MASTLNRGLVLAMLLAGCNDEVFYEPPYADRVACMKTRPQDSEADRNCYWMLIYEKEAK